MFCPLRYLILFLFVVLFLVVMPQRGRAHDLREILQAGVRLPNLLKGYQFSFVSRWTRPGEPPSGDLKVDVSQSGSSIKVKSSWIFSEEEKVDPLNEPIEYAYNGIHYQWLVTGMKELTFSKKCRHPTPYWDPSPLMWPYYWLAGQQTNWSDIKDIARWTERFEEATFGGHKNTIYDEESGWYKDYSGGDKEGVVHFDSVVFPCPQLNMDTVQVEFAKELGYYPLECSGFVDGKECMNARVVRHKTYDIDGMFFVFPLEVKVSVWESTDDVLDMQWVVDETSISINPRLDEDMFTIPHSRAKRVTDYDQMLEDGILPSSDVADDGRDIVAEPLPKRTWNTLSLVTVVSVNLILIALIVYSLLRRRRS